MRDESSGFSDTKNIEYVTVPKPIPIQKIEKPRLWSCIECSKPTRSHRYEDGAVICHGCFEKKTEEEKNECARLHTKDRYPEGSPRGTTEDSSDSSKTEKQALPQ